MKNSPSPEPRNSQPKPNLETDTKNDASLAEPPQPDPGATSKPVTTLATGFSGRPSMVRPLKLSDIRCDAGTQVRAEINEEVVAEYAERMQALDQFPAVEVVYDGKDYFLVDGFHRVLAAKRARLPSFECTIYPGTLKDAVWLALGANRKNGLRRTTADKFRAIELALTKFPEKTQQQVAQQVGCDRSYVSKVTNQLVNSHKLQVLEARQGKDGKKRPAKYKPRKKPVAKDAPTKQSTPSRATMLPAIPTSAETADAPAPPTIATPAPPKSQNDFVTRVKASFSRWMEQWAAADMPKVRSTLRELLRE